MPPLNAPLAHLSTANCTSYSNTILSYRRFCNWWIYH